MSGNGTVDFDYAAAEHDVRTRDGLSAAIRAPLSTLPRERWAGTPGYEGFPAHFLAVHAELRGAAASLVERLEGVADVPVAERAEHWRDARVTGLARGLTGGRR